MSDVKIPEDVQAQAEAIAHELVDHAFKQGKLVNAYLAEFIARAILAETERCAKIADEHAKARTSKEFTATQAGRLTARSIAFAIRSTHE